MAAPDREGGDLEEGNVIVRRRSWRRVTGLVLLGLLILLTLLTAGLWIARRPIATQVLQDQFEQKGVRATYSLDRVGLRTQEVRDRFRFYTDHFGVACEQDA